MNQTTFTRGAKADSPHVVTTKAGAVICKLTDSKLPPDELRANSQLIVAAFNAATAAQDMGFDGIKAVEALPKLLEALREVMQVTYPAAHSNTCVFSKTGNGCDCHLGRVQAALAQAGQKPRGKDYDTPEGA